MVMVVGWKYYNHALIPTTEPHEKCIFSKKQTHVLERLGGIPYSRDGQVISIAVMKLIGGT